MQGSWPLRFGIVRCRVEVLGISGFRDFRVLGFKVKVYGFQGY